MSRSTKKGPFISAALKDKIDKMNQTRDKKVIRTWARASVKAIKSAAANAEHNFNLNRDDLVLKQLLIDEGPTYKRRRPVSRSMAHEYFHRTCHITAVVEDQPDGGRK